MSPLVFEIVDKSFNSLIYNSFQLPQRHDPYGALAQTIALMWCDT
jgi:hypothetical protein